MSFFMCTYTKVRHKPIPILTYPVIDLVGEFITDLASMVRRLF